MLLCALRHENSWKHLRNSVYFIFRVFVFVVVLFLIQFVFSEIFKMISHNLGMFVFVTLHVFISIFSVICIRDIGEKNPEDLMYHLMNYHKVNILVTTTQVKK